MQDMSIIHDLFDILGQCVEGSPHDGRGDTHGMMTPWLVDPHKEADDWIAATPEARERLRAVADAKHAAIVKELARVRLVSNEDYLERKRRNMKDWRLHNSEVYRARQKAWRDAHKDYGRNRLREYRAAVKADPVRYAADREADRLRMRARRARCKAFLELNSPPREERSPEEKKKAKRDWNREYQRAHPRKLTPEQLVARNEYQKRKYRERTPEQIAAKLEAKRTAWSNRTQEQQNARAAYLRSKRKNDKR